jgi:hypothetical protein
LAVGLYKRILRAFELDQVFSLQGFLNEIQLLQWKPDAKIWINIERDGKFSVKSCNTLIDGLDYHGTCSFTPNIWDSAAPLKIQTFLWLAVQNRLYTKSFLF